MSRLGPTRRVVATIVACLALVACGDDTLPCDKVTAIIITAGNEPISHFVIEVSNSRWSNGTPSSNHVWRIQCPDNVVMLDGTVTEDTIRTYNATCYDNRLLFSGEPAAIVTLDVDVPGIGSAHVDDAQFRSEPYPDWYPSDCYEPEGRGRFIYVDIPTTP